ncbi:MAG: hypothetical protein OEW40_17545, partial [Cyclobacteriaceae bacterium]|nr:hypothetical protein [Cyclobacteriaceae bacterium]
MRNLKGTYLLLLVMILAFSCSQDESKKIAEKGAEPPKMKMTTDIPESITTPESVETRLGTLKFFDGFPDDATTQKVYDNLDFMNGVNAFLNAVPGASAEAIRTGWASQGAN